MFTTVHGTSEQRGIGVAQSRRAAGLPTDNGFTEANRAKFRLIGILVIEVILFAALGESAGASDELAGAFAAMESMAGIVFALIMVVTWILLAVAVKGAFRAPPPYRGIRHVCGILQPTVNEKGS